MVKLDKIEGTKLYVSGVDLLDGTPIVDIKPYVPYVDAVASATTASHKRRLLACKSALASMRSSRHNSTAKD